MSEKNIDDILRIFGPTPDAPVEGEIREMTPASAAAARIKFRIAQSDKLLELLSEAT
jgi:hypothetical protein